MLASRAQNCSASFIKKTPLAAAIAAMLASVGMSSALAAPITLEGNYIKIGTSDLGTIGSGGNTSPGILYDNTGTGTFNTAYDYLTPGTPFEGFTVRATSGGTTYNAMSNNDPGNTTSGLTGTLANASSGSYRGVVWTGSYTPTSETKLFDIVNAVGFNATDKQVKITTTITAARALTDLYFVRYTDPDAQAAGGDTSSTTNIRGQGSVAATNLVYAEALVSKYVIGLLSNASSGVNTGVSASWSTDPTIYQNGTNDGDGDFTIGLSHYLSSLALNDSITFTYYYIFGSDIAAAIEASLGPGTRVVSAANLQGNSPARGAATVIDANPALLNLFSGLSGNTEVSNAASQTLPLLTGGSQIASQNALNGINRVIQARMSANRGMSSGDVFTGDKNFWLKPFGSRATQDTTQGVSGYKAETYGLAAGFDDAVSPSLRLGVAFAYAGSNIDSNSKVAKQSAKVDVYQLIGYGSYSLDERTEINFQVDAGRNVNDGKRTIAFTNTVAKSDYNSTSAHVGVGFARTYPISSRTSLVPSVRADYTWIRDDSYREKDAGLLNLDVNGRSTKSFIVGIDGKVAHQLNERTTLTANLGVGYDTINERSAITAAFAGAPGAAFVTYGIDPSPWIGQAGLGLVYQASNGVEVSGRYDAEHRTGFLNHTASMKVRWSF